MLKIENTEVFGWEAAIRGMRNPMNSWDKSDSYYGMIEDPSPINPDDWAYIILGENDLKLMRSLAKAGDDHAKFLRMVNVTLDITAPLYWWKEFDTYKVGTVANSCSTMHKLTAKEFELDDFSHEYLSDDWNDEDSLVAYNNEYDNTPADVLCWLVEVLNKYREKYIATNDQKYWRYIVQILPASYNQKRTVQLNYAVLKNMYFARRNHKLSEWHTLCDWILKLPYFKEIVVGE